MARVGQVLGAYNATIASVLVVLGVVAREGDQGHIFLVFHNDLHSVHFESGQSLLFGRNLFNFVTRPRTLRS